MGREELVPDYRRLLQGEFQAEDNLPFSPKVHLCPKESQVQNCHQKSFQLLLFLMEAPQRMHL